MFDAQGLTELVELMLSCGLSCPIGKQSVGKLLAVVGQDASDLDRTGCVQGLEKAFGAGSGLVGLECHIDPAGRPADGNEEIAAPGLIGHLR